MLQVISYNPVNDAPRPKRVQNEVQSPKMNAVRDTLALAREQDNPLFAAFRLAAFTGMRRGEIAGLTWERINLNDGILLVEQQVTRCEGRGAILETPKSKAGRRRIDLDAGTVEVLAEHRERQDADIAEMRSAYRNQGYVFADALGDYLDPMVLLRALQEAAKEAGCPGLTIRDLRHFHASVSQASGGDIASLSKRLGHSRISITLNTYTHAVEGKQQELADRFAAVMDGPNSSGRIAANGPESPVTVAEIA